MSAFLERLTNLDLPQELCGTSPPVLSFVSTYTNTRFPAVPAPATRPQSTAASRNASPHNSRPSTPSGGQRGNVTRGREVELAPLPPTSKSRPVRKLERLMARLDRMTFGEDFGKEQRDEEDGQEPDFEELKGCFCQGESDHSHSGPLLLTAIHVQLECIPCHIIRQCVPAVASSFADCNYHTSLARHVSGRF
jgi:hypothetical protein